MRSIESNLSIANQYSQTPNLDSSVSNGSNRTDPYTYDRNPISQRKKVDLEIVSTPAPKPVAPTVVEEVEPVKVNQSPDDLLNKINAMKKHLLKDRFLEEAFQGGEMADFVSWQPNGDGDYTGINSKFKMLEKFGNGYKPNSEDQKLADTEYQNRLANTPTNQYGCKTNSTTLDTTQSLDQAKALKKEIMAELDDLSTTDQKKVLEGMKDIFKWIDITAKSQGQTSKFWSDYASKTSQLNVEWGNPSYEETLKKSIPILKSQYLEHIKRSDQAHAEEIEISEKIFGDIEIGLNNQNDK